MAGMRWYKGNLHCHTTESDGDVSPAEVAAWYGEHGYDFLVLSDHNLMTVIGDESGKHRAGAPLIIAGEEVTEDLEIDPIHVVTNGIGIRRVVEPVEETDQVLSTVQANVDAILRAGGIASLTPPYFRQGFDHKLLVGIKGAKLMEVYNGHPANVRGDPRNFSYEELWDAFLTAGKAVFGTATDDSHNYFEFGADNSNPGRAWVVVRAPELSEGAILESLVSGDFYASTGVTLSGMESSGQSISLEITQKSIQAYSTTFVGRGGETLAQESGPEASYHIRGHEGYVRARVESSWGGRAWTQPVFIT